MTQALAATDPKLPAPPRIFSWPRVRFALLLALAFALLRFGSPTPLIVWFIRMAFIVMVALVPFGLFERWPKRLPGWLPRWVLQLLGVMLVVPFTVMIAWLITGGGRLQTFTNDPVARAGFYFLMGISIFFAPWITFGALVRQREALARDQALRFQLERSELERKAVDARMRLMQAQVQPHFLFNTLANVRALVKAGSPQAPDVLDSLIAYLRAAVPGLGETDSTVAQEVKLVQAYLELMHMRMPDRLQYSVHADDAALPLRCPPVTLLTLVENSVRHGIDPSEEGGHIDVKVMVREGRCIARVVDTGVGLQAVQGEGTGLDTLRERLKLTFGDSVQLRLTSVAPHGVCAELEFPAQSAKA